MAKLNLNRLKSLIARNKLKEAIYILKDYSQQESLIEIHDTLIVILSRLNEYKKRNLRGVVSEENSRLLNNRIKSDLIELINEIPQIGDTEKKLNRKKHYKKPIIAIFSILLLVILFKSYNSTTIQNKIQFIGEKIIHKNDTLFIYFSIQNLLSNENITVYDIHLNTLFLDEIGNQNYKKKRIELEVLTLFPLLKASKVRIDSIKSKSLFDSSFTCKIDPQNADSFMAKFLLPESANNLHFLFSFDAYFFDSSGIKNVIPADKIFLTVFDDILGFKKIEEFPYGSYSAKKIISNYSNINHITE